LIPLGVVIANEWGGSAQDSLYDLHRSIGAAVIPLVILRLIYRWTPFAATAAEDIPAMPTTYRACYTLGPLRPSDRAAAHRLDRGLRLIGPPVIVFWLVRVATDLAREPRISEHLFSVHSLIGIGHHLPCGPRISARRSTSFCGVKDRILMRMISG